MAGNRIWQTSGVAASLDYSSVTDANDHLYIHELRLHLASPVAASLRVTVKDGDGVATFDTVVYTQDMTAVKNLRQSWAPPVHIPTGDIFNCYLVGVKATYGLTVIGD